MSTAVFLVGHTDSQRTFECAKSLLIHSKFFSLLFETVSLDVSETYTLSEQDPDMFELMIQFAGGLGFASQRQRNRFRYTFLSDVTTREERIGSLDFYDMISPTEIQDLVGICKTFVARDDIILRARANNSRGFIKTFDRIMDRVDLTLNHMKVLLMLLNCQAEVFIDKRRLEGLYNAHPEQCTGYMLWFEYRYGQPKKLEPIGWIGCAESNLNSWFKDTDFVNETMFDNYELPLKQDLNDRWIKLPISDIIQKSQDVIKKFEIVSDDCTLAIRHQGTGWRSGFDNLFDGDFKRVSYIFCDHPDVISVMHGVIHSLSNSISKMTMLFAPKSMSDSLTNPKYNYYQLYYELECYIASPHLAHLHNVYERD